MRLREVAVFFISCLGLGARDPRHRVLSHQDEHHGGQEAAELTTHILSIAVNVDYNHVHEIPRHIEMQQHSDNRAVNVHHAIVMQNSY